MSNQITAYFKGRVGVAESVYQNDYGIVMAFDSIDLPAHFDCYFSKLNQEEAVPGVGADNMVAIPNSVLADPGNVTIHIPMHTGENDSEVEYVVYFKVIGRARPIDDGTPTQMTAIEQALALLQNPITNIEQIVNEALAFTGETFEEMQEDLDEWKTDTEEGLETWKGGVESDFDNLEAQFDAAVAAVTTDTEVTNIRVGDDNVTYTTAGEAVRTQFSNVKSAISGTYGSLLDFDCERGTWSGTATKDNSSPTTRLRSTYAIPVKKGDFVKNEALIRYSVVFVPTALTPVSATSWNDGVWTASEDGFIRISMKKTDSSAISDADIDLMRDALKIFVTSFKRTKTDRIERLNEEITLNQTGFKYFDTTIFQLGGLSSGAIDAANTHRIVTTNIQNFDYPICIKPTSPNSGTRFGLSLYAADNTWIQDIGWFTDSYVVAANQKFRLVAAHDPDYTVSLYGLEHEIPKIICYSTFLESRLEEIETDVSSAEAKVESIGNNLSAITVTSNVANGTAWNPNNADCVCTEGYIGVEQGDLISMRVKTFPDDGCYYGFGYVTYDNTKTYIQSVDAVASRRFIRDMIIPQNVAYIRFTVVQFKADGTVKSKRKTDYQANDFVYTIKKNVLPLNDQISGWLQQAKRINYATTATPIQSIANLLGFIHLSDVHGDVDNIKRILDIAKVFPDYVSDIIHTGDSVKTYIEAGNPFEDVDGGDKILNVIGNHDCWHEGDAGYYGTKQDAYELIIENNVSAWGVTQPENADTNYDCYYYKDYATNGFRLIVLDCMHWDSSQATWFTNTLTDAKANSLAVIIGEHYAPASGLTKINCPFMSLDLSFPPSTSERFTDDAFDAVDTFISGGGEFVCWLVGHQHADYIGTPIGHDSQLMIGIENAGTGVQNLDDNRIAGTPTQDCFNCITFDKTNKLVRIVRIGCNSDRYLRQKDVLCINYSTMNLLT